MHEKAKRVVSDLLPRSIFKHLKTTEDSKERNDARVAVRPHHLCLRDILLTKPAQYKHNTYPESIISTYLVSWLAS